MKTGKHMMSQMEKSRDTILQFYKSLNVGGVFISPPIDTAANILDLLALQRSYPYWLKVFFKSVLNFY